MRFIYLVLMCIGLTHVSAREHRVEEVVELPCVNKKCRLPSGVIYVEQQGASAFFKAWGLADYQDHAPFSLDTQLHVGSLKKQFIAVALLQLAQQKKVNLHDPIAKYLRFNTKLKAKDPRWVHRTTLHQLLTHVTKLGNDPKALMKEGREDFLKAVWVSGVTQSDPVFSYSNTAYRLLSYVVEQVSGLDIKDYFKQYFFIPLGMNDSGFHSSEVPLKLKLQWFKKLALPYSFLSKKGVLVESYPSDMFRMFGNNAFVTTPRDLIKWNKALYSRTIFHSDQKIAAEMFAAMTGLYSIDPEDPYPSYYGYGIKTTFRNGKTVYWHEGLLRGACVYLEYTPSTDTHVLLFSNTSGHIYNPLTGEAVLDSLANCAF